MEGETPKSTACKSIHTMMQCRANWCQNITCAKRNVESERRLHKALHCGGARLPGGHAAMRACPQVSLPLLSSSPSLARSRRAGCRSCCPPLQALAPVIGRASRIDRELLNSWVQLSASKWNTIFQAICHSLAGAFPATRTACH